MRRPGRRRQHRPVPDRSARLYFDPKALLCTGGKVPPASLTADQVTTMQKYYAGTIDPVNGQVIYPGYERGNETDNVLGLGLVLMESLP
jgi:feruloyl esterase